MADKKWEKLLQDYERHTKRIRKSTSVNINESTIDRRNRIAQLEADYIKWFTYYFPHYAKSECADFHKKAANKIISSKVIRYLMEWYRGSAKSVHADVGIPLFLYLAKRDLFFMLLVGETEPKAKRLLGDIQAELQYNERIINDYGNKLKFGDWANGEFATIDDVRFLSVGFGQSPRGAREGANRPDYIVVDDIDNKKHVNNDRLMSEGEDWVFEDLMKCFDSSETAVQRFVFANNNFNRNSITNRVKLRFEAAAKKFKAAGEPVMHFVHKVCAVKDLINFEPTWLARASAKYWRNQYNENWISFCREMMHQHIVPGKIFKNEHIRWCKVLPLNQYDALTFYGDLSYKDTGDYKAMVLVGKKGREYHIIYSFCRQTSKANCAIWLYDLWESKKLYNHNISFKIDGLFAQDEFVSDFDAEGDTRGYHIAITPDKKPKEGKYERIESDLGKFERGWIYFNEAEKESQDQINGIEQYLYFEKGSKSHDDYPDACHSAFDELNRADFVERFEPRFIPRSPSKRGY